MTTEELFNAVKEIEVKTEEIYRNDNSVLELSLSEINKYSRQLSLLGILYRAQTLAESISRGEQ